MTDAAPDPPMPKMRLTMTILKSKASVSVTEMADTVRVTVADDDAGIERKIELTLPEAWALARHLNKACQLVLKRRRNGHP